MTPSVAAATTATRIFENVVIGNLLMFGWVVVDLLGDAQEITGGPGSGLFPAAQARRGMTRLLEDASFAAISSLVGVHEGRGRMPHYGRRGSSALISC